MIADDEVPHVIRPQIPVNGGPHRPGRIAIAGDDHERPGADGLQGLAEPVEVAFPGRGRAYEALMSPAVTKERSRALIGLPFAVWVVSAAQATAMPQTWVASLKLL